MDTNGPIAWPILFELNQTITQTTQQRASELERWHKSEISTLVLG